MGLRISVKMFSSLAAGAALALNCTPGHAQMVVGRSLQAMAATAPAHQDDYGYWRQQVRVASPTRQGRWNSAPTGAVRVYNRRFDPRWNWRSAPRYRVVYTYYRGDMWFLDPTTGWAYSIDRYGIVYTADPYRGWVYSLGPLTRWTADLLYFFDLYRFDRGNWYCRDYDYLVDLWEGDSRHGYYTYDTAYSTLWGWEPYFSSSSFISYSNQFTVIWVGQVRNNYDYVERNPHYRRELIDSIGLPAVNAAPPRTVSPRAVTTSAYWEARDLAAAGMQPPPRGRDTGSEFAGLAAGTVVDARQAPARVVESGSPAPGFNAPFPSGTYGFGVPADARGRSRDESLSGSVPEADGAGSNGARNSHRTQDSTMRPDESMSGNGSLGVGRGRDAGRTEADAPVYRDQTPSLRERTGTEDQPRYQQPSYPPAMQEQESSPPERYERATGRSRDAGSQLNQREQPRFEAPPEQPRSQEPREQPRFEAPPEQPRSQEPREQPRFEAPAEQPRYQAPREQPRFEAPPEQPRFEAPPEQQRGERSRDEGDQQEKPSLSRDARSGLREFQKED